MSYVPVGVDNDNQLPAEVRIALAGSPEVRAAIGDGIAVSVGTVLTTIPDMANSWWQNDDATYDPVTQRLFIGGISRGGAMYMGVSDLAQRTSERFKLTDERFLLDDHCGVGIAVDPSLSRRPIVAFSRHDRAEPDGSNCLYVREADSYTSYDNFGPEQRLGLAANSPVSYGGVIAKPTVANKRVNTVNASSVLTCVNASNVATAHALADGMRVRFTSAGAPAPFTVGTSYYVVNSAGDPTTFGLAATPGGAAIVATATSSDASKLLTDVGRGLVYARSGGGVQIWVARTADMHVSVTERPTSTPPRFDDTTAERFILIGKAYVDITRVGNTFWAFATSDPTPSGDPTAAVTTYFFKGTVADAGTMRNAAGATIGSLWGAAPAPGVPLIALGSGGADLVYTASGNEGVRWYDMARGGDAIVALRFDRRDFDVDDAGQPVQPGRNPENGGTYAVLRRTGSATANVWAWETIVPSGKPFGAYKSVYVGGAVFERDDANANALIAVVESGGIWSVRRYVRSGAAYAAGTWTEDAVLYTAPAGHKLGRPRIPTGAEGLTAGDRVFVVSEYTHYSILNFTDFHAMQKVVKY